MEYFDYLPELSMDSKKEYFRAGADPDSLTALSKCRLSVIDNMALGKLIEKAAASGHFAAYRRVRMGIISNFTLDHLKYSLIAAAFRRGILLELEFSPFDSLHQVAMGRISPFRSKLDFIFIYQHPQNYYNAGIPFEEIKEELTHLSLGIKEQYDARLILSTSHARHYDQTSAVRAGSAGGYEVFNSGYNRIIAEIADTHGMLVLDVNKLASMVGLLNWHRPIDYYRSKVPFRFECSDIFSDYLTRLLAAYLGLRKKVVVLDMDGVLWGGILGDDKQDNILIGSGTPEGEAFQDFQRYLHDELFRTGIVLAASSKNDIGNVEDLFNNCSELVLKREHFAILQVNWQDKVSNIKAIAESLNLGLDSIVFIDDNMHERALVREKLPEVCTIELGKDPAYYPALIANSGYFDYYELSDEDLRRSQSYLNNLKRIEIQQNFSDYSSYLKSLDMVLRIEPFERQSMTRIAQLINKTNQFNLMKDRFTPQEIERISESGDMLCYQISLEDKLENFGIISAFIAAIEGDSLCIKTWVMSCRVFNRDIENAVMNFLHNLAKHSGLARITGSCREVKANQYTAEIFTQRGFALVEQQGDRAIYEIETGRYEESCCSISRILIDKYTLV
ncbi:HAD-IIIC family phosphatase [Paenibacillus sp. HN-1]|uniref:HAD-IIIC family phosphatase n=1 Tax=Paenibacillus TaxID=44249 RepID=UPI001CA95C0C|nr:MULTISPECIES: HAD-IIIC family phosphatase [Paenibacillus]MBY9080757.1 HAD-IIIC family phosphatase [Paenibacillus sp. CGMCC 1.18879]MBY9085251.1 HAD-IIIC family phosphatase [Paenibacillus sinensis]